ncbi:MAG: hypothetical protein NZ700_11815 [Gemmataceae bacterium]|nr:hypothetical protein [Gemmataceae bacterium]MDW8266851.1 hypothetical protein [Gemmataceae bacterium]
MRRGTLLFALLSLLYLAVTVPSERAAFARVFEDFNLLLPWTTELFLAIPTTALYVAALAIGLGLLLAQWLARDQVSATWVNTLVFAGCCLVLCLFHVTMTGPVLRLFEAMSR